MGICILNEVHVLTATHHSVVLSSKLSQSDWRSALKLSTMWEFPTIQAQAIHTLYESLDSMTKIRLARKYAIPQWLLAGFEELAQRPCALNQRECRSLGLYATAGIFRVREKAHLFSFQQHTTSDVKKNAFNDSSFDYRGAIREELKSELGEYRA